LGSFVPGQASAPVLTADVLRYAQPVGRHRALLYVLVSVISVAGLGSDYSGCGNTSVPEEGTPLPASSGGLCLVDEECGMDECSFFDCVDGACIAAGPIIDADGDGAAPAPCGTDCDDTRASVRLGAPETCDGTDEDCDGTIDEAAIGTAYRQYEDGLRDAEIAALGSVYVVVGESESGGLAAYVVDRDGAQGPSAQIVPPVMDQPMDTFAIATDGSLLYVAYARYLEGAELATVSRAGLELSADDVEPIDAAGDVRSVALHVALGDTWAAVDALDAGVQTRSLWRRSSGALTALEPSDVGPALGDDGSSLVVQDGARVLSFRDAAGVERGRQTMTGDFATGRPIAAGEFEVLVAYADAFDYLLASVTIASSRSPTMAPYGSGRSDRLSLYRAPEGVLFLRTSDGGPRAWVLESDLRTIVRGFTTAEISPLFGSASRMSAAVASGDTAILSSYAGTSVITFLACTTSP
jgi:hypothetical protein